MDQATKSISKVVDTSHFKASKRVWTTTELLENILLRLPTIDILLAQRVSKVWYGIIRNSVYLQRALFLCPISGNICPDWSSDRGWILRGGYLVDYWAARIGRCQKIYMDVKVEHNKLLGRLFDKTYSTHGILSMCKSDLPPSADYPEASWRKMLITQPPCRSFGDTVLFRKETFCGECIDYTCLADGGPSNELGITLLDLVDHVGKKTPDVDSSECCELQTRYWHIDIGDWACWLG